MKHFVDFKEQFSLEIRYQWYSKHFLVALAVTLFCCGISVVGLATRTITGHDELKSSLAQAQSDGISLSDALKAPVVVTKSDSMVSTDNPLRYELERQQVRVSSLDSIGFSLNTLQLMNFLFVPPMAFFATLILASKESRSGTSKIIFVRRPRLAVHLAQLGAGISLSGFLIIISLGVSFLGGKIGKLLIIRERNFSDSYPIPKMGLWAEMSKSIALSAVVIIFFAILGLVAALISRNVLAPAILFLIWDLALPISFQWDPRSLILVLGTKFLNFPGSFEPFTKVSPDAGTAIIALGVLAGVSLTFAELFNHRRSLFG